MTVWPGALRMALPLERDPKGQRHSSGKDFCPLCFMCVVGVENWGAGKKDNGATILLLPANSAKCSAYIHHYPMQIRHRPRKQSWSPCTQASHRSHADRNLPGHTSAPCLLHKAAVHLIETKTSSQTSQGTYSIQTVKAFPAPFPVKTNTPSTAALQNSILSSTVGAANLWSETK